MRLTKITVRAPQIGLAAAEVLMNRLRRRDIECAFADASADIALSLGKDIPPEGARVEARDGQIVISASDGRGMLYGVGRFLRLVAIGDGYMDCPDGYVYEGAPRFPLRGMQIGYRSLSNATDAWTKEQYTDYIEELALFGANVIEILPDDESEGKQTLMRYSVEEMNAHIVNVCLRLGLEIWYWLPHKGHFMDTQARRDAMMESVRRKLSALPHVDHIFIPGADPGDLEPEDLFAFAKLVKECAIQYHKGARMWLSPQVFSFTEARLDGFFALLRREPEWLDGVVFGPWERDDAFTLRAKTPARYPIRNYPDVSHTFHCQYPVPMWDPHFARTLGRECVSPRPREMKNIHNRFMNCFIGAVGYSDGIADDVNKFIWLDQEWNPDTDVKETLRDYTRLFIGDQYVDRFPAILFMLEENIARPVAGNAQIKRALALIEDMALDPALSENYRFQLHLLRAVYDACVQKRVIHDMDLENRAREIMEGATIQDIRETIGKALAVINDSDENPVALSAEARAWAIAGKLYRLIGLQSSVKEFHALRWMRAAFMDGLRMPFNDRVWLSRVWREALGAESDERAYALATRAARREKPPKGGLYVKMSEPDAMRYVVTPHDPVLDPGAASSAFVDHSAWGIGRHYQTDLGDVMPLADESGVATLFNVPLVFRFENLVKGADYRLRIVYFFNKNSPRIYMDVNGRVFEDYTAFGIDERDHTYLLDGALIPDGVITITLRALEGTVGPGVSELWLGPVEK